MFTVRDYENTNPIVLVLLPADTVYRLLTTCAEAMSMMDSLTQETLKDMIVFCGRSLMKADTEEQKSPVAAFFRTWTAVLANPYVDDNVKHEIEQPIVNALLKQYMEQHYQEED